jgi:hypothetical protein
LAGDTLSYLGTTKYTPKVIFGKKPGEPAKP